MDLPEELLNHPTIMDLDLFYFKVLFLTPLSELCTVNISKVPHNNHNIPPDTYY